MSAVYNIKSTPNGWQVNKFDDDFNLESSYEMTQSDGQVRCGCPAGARPSCRHRQMFPMLSLRVDSPWFLDFDTRQWVDPTGAASEASSTGPEITATKVDERLKNYNGPLPGDTFVEAVVDKTLEVVKTLDVHPFRRRL